MNVRRVSRVPPAISLFSGYVPMKAELVPENGDPPIPITRDVTIVGRRGFCDVVVNHDSLSKRHCVLVKTDGLLVVRDLASTNGTKVKGQRIRWAALLPDDRLAFGNYKVRVYLGPDDAPSPSERAPRQRARRTGAGSADPLVTPPISPPEPAEVGFAPPSPLGMPAYDPNGPWNDDDDSDDSWRDRLEAGSDDMNVVFGR
jgi:hypothetical protein